MPSANMRARRARRSRRGAVLLEALVVSGLLVLFMASAVFIHALYSNKLRSIASAREEAWKQALPGCSGGLAMALLNGLGTMTALNAVDDADDDMKLPDWMGDHGRGVGEPAAVNVATPAVLGSRSFSLKTRTSVACNEVGDDENGSLFTDLVNVVRRFW